MPQAGPHHGHGDGCHVIMGQPLCFWLPKYPAVVTTPSPRVAPGEGWAGGGRVMAQGGEWRRWDEGGGDRGTQRAHSQTMDSQTRQKRRMLAHRPATDRPRHTVRPQTDRETRHSHRCICTVRQQRWVHMCSQANKTDTQTTNMERHKIRPQTHRIRQDTDKGHNGAINTYTQSDHKQSGQRHTGTCQDHRHTAR